MCRFQFGGEYRYVNKKVNVLNVQVLWQKFVQCIRIEGGYVVVFLEVVRKDCFEEVIFELNLVQLGVWCEGERWNSKEVGQIVKSFQFIVGFNFVFVKVYGREMLRSDVIIFVFQEKFCDLCMNSELEGYQLGDKSNG